MARKPRIHYEGALYHVICRGNNKTSVFTDSSEKRNYLSILSHYKKKHEFKLYAYCIMDNHAHMLIEVSHVPLSKIMQGIQLVYTQRYNKKHHRTGHVFEQRYKAILCDKDQYLLSLINYIHHNPIRAQLNDGLLYKWSSHHSYIGNPSNSLVDTEFILSIFHSDPNECIAKYKSFMDFEEADIKSMKTEEFSKDIDEYTEIKKMDQTNDHKVFYNKSDIINSVTTYFNLNENDLFMQTKTRNIVKAKRITIHLLRKNTVLINTEIADILQVSMTTVTNALVIDQYRHELDAITLLIDKSKT